MREKPHTYTVCEDQPSLDKWDVKIRTFPTLAAARNMVARNYTAAERDGRDARCRPAIRNDRTGEYI